MFLFFGVTNMSLSAAFGLEAFFAAELDRMGGDLFVSCIWQLKAIRSFNTERPKCTAPQELFPTSAVVLSFVRETTIYTLVELDQMGKKKRWRRKNLVLNLPHSHKLIVHNWVGNDKNLCVSTEREFRVSAAAWAIPSGYFFKMLKMQCGLD